MTETGGRQQKRSRLRVLIADDVQETRRGTRLMVALIPYVEVVAIAKNGRQAIDMTRESLPDIALMDINMPELDGLSAIQAMLKIRPEMVCIVISAERENQTLRDAMSAGAREYLVKPFTIDELEQAVERASKLVISNKQRFQEAMKLRRQREVFLKQLAHEYAKTRRTDDKAIKVFEQLATNPNCELRWLMTLAMIYIIRQQWGKLRALAGNLEQRARRKATTK